MFKNRDLREKQWLEKEEVRLERRKVHKDELQNLCSSPGAVW
jgi:hypothetical protein